MLKRLVIQNYGIIAREEIGLEEGLNIITGETGAGKSIMLGALRLTLGERVDSKVIFNKDEKVVVEATFTDTPLEVEQVLKENELDVYPELIMRREISPSGKSRAFVNDTPVTLEVMQAISALIIDLHQQFESLALNTARQQYALLDGFAQVTGKVDNYRKKFQEFTQLKEKVRSLEEAIAQSRRERDLIEFELQELEERVPGTQTYEEWEEEFAFQDQAGEILETVNKTVQVLTDGEFSVVDSLRSILTDLWHFRNATKDLREAGERLQSTIVELEDIGMALGNISDAYSPDPKLRDELEDKINNVRKLLLKHGVQTIDELLALRAEHEQRIGDWQSHEQELEDLKLKRDKLKSELEKTANEISTSRHEHAGAFSKKVTSQLADLEMKNARFEIVVNTSDKLHSLGIDDIEFLFAANLGSQPMPVAKVASGGELSRLNLCIKSVVSSSVSLPSMVFDEIDTGVSGQVALKMGSLLKKLSNDHQIIMITHSPQIAARADLHLKVAKKDMDKRSIAEIFTLDPEERILEIAKMLSGDPPSDAAVLNARQLVEV